MNTIELSDPRIDGDPHLRLMRDEDTGIAWVEDGHLGVGHTCHSNISRSGSVRGMKNLGYWGQKDRTVRSHGFIYNVDSFIVTDEFDRVAADHCQCEGCQERRENIEKSSSQAAIG